MLELCEPELGHCWVSNDLYILLYKPFYIFVIMSSFFLIYWFFFKSSKRSCCVRVSLRSVHFRQACGYTMKWIFAQTINPFDSICYKVWGLGIVWNESIKMASLLRAIRSNIPWSLFYCKSRSSRGYRGLVWYVTWRITKSLHLNGLSHITTLLGVVPNLQSNSLNDMPKIEARKCKEMQEICRNSVSLSSWYTHLLLILANSLHHGMPLFLQIMKLCDNV